MLPQLANAPAGQLWTLGKNDKWKGFSIFCNKNLAAPYLPLESRKSEAEFLYLSYLLLVLRMAESAGAILICNSAVLQWTIQGRKEYSESEDRKRLDKDFQKKRGGGVVEKLKKTRQGRGSLGKEPFKDPSWVWSGYRIQRHSLEKWEQKIFKKKRDTETLAEWEKTYTFPSLKHKDRSASIHIQQQNVNTIILF